MGTRINVLLDHDLADYRDRPLVLARLDSALPVALGVRDYWQAANPHSPHDELAVWRADPMSPCNSVPHCYTGPGELFLYLTTTAARIRTGGRWRGFLSIEPLRRVHMAAFRKIADSLGSTSLALYADSCEVDDLFWAGRTQWECVELMERMWGPPQWSVEEIDPKISLAAERTVPLGWFLESTESKLFRRLSARWTQVFCMAAISSNWAMPVLRASLIRSSCSAICG